MKSLTNKTIVLTGPESTGKTTLTKKLSSFFKAQYYPEFARDYIENLNREYTFNDVVIIAKQQIEIFKKQNENKCIFYDTGLIITKIWFREVYGKVPSFINIAINNIKIDLYLLCYPDIKWVSDNVRENGGSKRLKLFNIYKTELDNYGFKYLIIKGEKDKRFSLAKEYLSSAYCL